MGGDPGTDMDRYPTDLAVDQLALPRVQAGSDVDPERAVRTARSFRSALRR
jgi:hypothetical protein